MSVGWQWGRGFFTNKDYVTLDIVIVRIAQLCSLHIFLSSTLSLGGRDVCLQSLGGHNAVPSAFRNSLPPPLPNMFMAFVVM